MDLAVKIVKVYFWKIFCNTIVHRCFYSNSRQKDVNYASLRAKDFSSNFNFNHF